MSERFSNFLQRWLITTLGVLVAALLVRGIRYDAATALFLASLSLGLLNTFIRPILVFFTLPFVLLTLGLGLWVINALLLLFVGSVVKGFHVTNFWSALIGALIISMTSFAANILLGRGPTLRSPGSTKNDKKLSQRGPYIDV